jgi:hypothetical protein
MGHRAYRRSCPVLLFALLGCLGKASIWITTPSSVGNLTFGLAETRGGSKPLSSLENVVVQTCFEAGSKQEVYWEITDRRAVPSHIPLRIQYGVTPKGFTTWVEPKPLSPGCFEVTIRGEAISTGTNFTVLANGAVIELPKSRKTY